MKTKENVEVLVIGSGIAGIATAYYLCTRYRKSSVLLVDPRAPMSFTSAQSGDNYRNWWPHPTMTDFTNHSIDLMEQIAGETSNVINMTRRGYLLATRRKDIDDLIAGLHIGYQRSGKDSIRVHDAASRLSYRAPDADDWRTAPAGVDVLSKHELIRQVFPSISEDIANVVHIRRGGDISGQQLGQYMLEKIRSAGGKRLVASVRSVEIGQRFSVEVEGPTASERIKADVLVDAAGPFAGEVAAMVGVDLPIENVYQQKIAFDDRKGAIPRRLPFAIDLDGFEFEWSDEERAFLSEDAEMSWLIEPLPGGAHCRPEGGDKGTWVKLGWAFNRNVSLPQQDLANEPLMRSEYPEILMRAATRLNPSLKTYTDNMPTRFSHYGGYYTMTRENWPLIGPLGVDGAFIAGALSGFGSMSACAAGALCAAWIADGDLPEYASQLSLARYADEQLVAELAAAPSKGLL
ncbi:MAG: FAD-binding oxidoreductase [Gammaproteobacteria bacterium]|nr:FAD-binding oxidoreductase [Gammaproteobacteria bacterium]